MATKAKKKPRAKKAKQGYLDPEMEPPTCKEVDHAAENYYEAMMERVELSKREDETKTALIEKMKENQLARYEFDDFVVTLTDKTNVAVKKKKKAVADDPNEHAPDEEAND